MNEEDLRAMKNRDVVNDRIAGFHQHRHLRG